MQAEAYKLLSDASEGLEQQAKELSSSKVAFRPHTAPVFLHSKPGVHI